MTQKQPLDSTWLVILPSKSINWSLWCIDFIRISLGKNRNFVLLDLSEFVNDSRKSKGRRFLNTLYRTNGLRILIEELSDGRRLKYLRPRDIDHFKNSVEKFHLQHVNAFRNGLDAEFFEQIRKRILSESQIESKNLSEAKRIFDLVSAITLQVIRQEGVTKLITPGGRTLVPSACISVAQKTGIYATILESNDAGSLGYFEYPESFRSNCTFIQREIDRKWLEANLTKYDVAKNYLENKLYRQDSKGTNFAIKFKQNIDLQILASEKLAVVFLTSGFEFVSFVENVNEGDYGRDHQRLAVENFCRIARQNGFTVILRGHPPSSGREALFAIEDEEWAQFCRQNGCTYLPSNSEINSYDLMKKSNLNAVYISSAAIDSLILGAQTVILGNAEFAHLVPELCAFDQESIRNRFASLNRRINLEEIYPFAFHMSTLGKEISRASITKEGVIMYDGKQINPPRLPFLASLIRKT